jgi:branched-chain amino acid transport system ATP-binding protein
VTDRSGTLPSSPASAGEEASTPVLDVRGVVRRYGGLTAVDDVSLTLGPRERLAVIGPNGAGKTTLFKLIAGEVSTSAGTVAFEGRDVTRWSSRRRARLGIARTFQVSNLFPTLTVADNVTLAAQALRAVRWSPWPGAGAKAAAADVDGVLEKLMLTTRRDVPVESLSHGERRQVEIAMALVVQPRLLLLDEPAAGLSVVERQRLREVLAGLTRSVPYLLIEHDLTLALGLADRVLCLDNGRTIATGTPDEIRRNTRVREVYLGRAATS